MVYIKKDNLTTLNADLVTSFSLVPHLDKSPSKKRTSSKKCSFSVDIVCLMGEFTGYSHPTQIPLLSKSFDYDYEQIEKAYEKILNESYSKRDQFKSPDQHYLEFVQEQIIEMNKILDSLLIELEATKKNGETFFDLEDFKKKHMIENNKPEI